MYYRRERGPNYDSESNDLARPGPRRGINKEGGGGKADTPPQRAEMIDTEKSKGRD